MNNDVDKYLGGVVRRWILIIIVFAALTPLFGVVTGLGLAPPVVISAVVIVVLAWLALRLR